MRNTLAKRRSRRTTRRASTSRAKPKQKVDRLSRRKERAVGVISCVAEWGVVCVAVVVQPLRRNRLVARQPRAALAYEVCGGEHVGVVLDAVADHLGGQSCIVVGDAKGPIDRLL